MRMASYAPLVVAGCSGVGKGTLIHKLMASEPEAFGFSVSHTTRAPRPGEVEGVDYHFEDVEEMKRDIDAGLFIEHACVHGNYYGTSKKGVERVAAAGKVCILDIDIQGVQSVKASTLGAKYLWIDAPDMAILEQRLRGRGTETEDKVLKRLETAKTEMAYAHPASGPRPFDHYLLNDDVETASAELRRVLGGWYPHLARDADSEAAAPPPRANPCSGATKWLSSFFEKQ